MPDWHLDKASIMGRLVAAYISPPPGRDDILYLRRSAVRESRLLRVGLQNLILNISGIK